jgi:hypothetical protein
MKDMYTIIPQHDKTHIIHNTLSKYNKKVADIKNMLQMMLQQNYFHFDNQ